MSVACIVDLSFSMKFFQAKEYQVDHGLTHRMMFNEKDCREEGMSRYRKLYDGQSFYCTAR